MKILFIAPLPPPITGHSLAAKVLLDELEKNHTVNTVDLSKNSFKEGIDGFKRILEVVGILKEVWQKKRGCGILYLTISESFAGNIKDIFIYILCFRSLPKMFIHLHGGSIKRLLWDKHPLLASVNRFFIKRMAGVIITGKSHLPVFQDTIPAGKIHIVPNFAQEYVFASGKQIADKFNLKPLRILYMSNLIPKKGYNELADAFLGMNEELRSKICIDFAGSFDSEKDKLIFMKKISNYKQVQYHGIVSDQQKKDLFSQAHIFCLPTSYFEGQPISILEAYASGCVVLTTGQSGIRDIFTDRINGFEIEPESPESIRERIAELIDKREVLVKIASHNFLSAKEKYRISIHTNAVENIFIS